MQSIEILKIVFLGKPSLSSFFVDTLIISLPAPEQKYRLVMQYQVKGYN